MRDNRTDCRRCHPGPSAGCRYHGNTYNVCRARLGPCRCTRSFETKLVITGAAVLIIGIILFSCTIC